MKRLLYLILKRNIICKLKKHGYGSQFIDNVMEALGMQTDITGDYLKALDDNVSMK